MNACLLRISKWRNYPANFSILSVLAVFLSQSCLGGQVSLALVLPASPVNWIAGPKEASLGTLADIKVPQGYRLTDEAGARVLLGRMKNPVPDGLIGILAPDSGKWWMVLTFSDAGCVKGADKERIDPVAILQAVQKRSMVENKERTEEGMASIVSVNWERPPVYDSESHSLEWAFRAETQSSKVVNDTMLLLGRRGVLAVIVVQPYDASSDLVPLQQLVKNITFKEGQRYTDYESGDKIAEVDLSQLIIDDKHQIASGDSLASSRGGIVVWIYSSLAGCGVMAGGILLYKRRRERKAGNAIYANEERAIAVAQSSSGNGHGNGRGNGQVNGSGSAFAGPDIQKIRSTPDNHGKLRRRKVFDYSKFYTHVVMELSSKSNHGAGSTLNGDGRSNLHTIHHTNGTNSNGGASTSQAIADATLDLIASQKNLIEEQKHLMQQQTGLIEERRKLIEEQNSLLKRQAEMIESQYSLKLD